MPAAPAPAPDLIDRLAQGARGWVVIAVLALTAALAGVSRLPVLDRDEGRFAQATAQMLESGDFVRIRFQEADRYKKPVGAYWLQAASVAALSDVAAREIWAYRVPSVAGAVLAALAAFWGGIALLGRRGAFIGSALLAVSALLAAEGGIAKTDALLCGFTTLGLAALARLHAGAGGRREAAIAWAALAAAFLIKGPVGPATAALCMLTLVLWERRAQWLAPLFWPPAMALGAAIAAPWPIAIFLATNGAFLAEAIGDIAPKVAGGGEHAARPPGLHLALLPALIFPASFALPAAAAAAWRAVRAPGAEAAHGGVRFLIAWAAPIFLAFELAPTKLAHYTLPAFPAIALLCGMGVAAGVGWRTRWAGAATFAIAALVWVGAAAALARLLPGDALADARRSAQAVIIGAGLAASAALMLGLLRKPSSLLAVALAAGLAAGWGLRDRLAPEARDAFVAHEAALALDRAGLNPRGAPGLRLWLVGFSEPSLVFATATRVTPATGVAAGASAMADDAILAEAAQRSDLEAGLAARGLRFDPIGQPVEGVHYNNAGRAISLQPGRVRPATQAAST